MQIQYWDEKQQQSFLRDATPYELADFSKGNEAHEAEAEPEATAAQLRTALAAAGMTAAQIDALFIAASGM